MPDTKSTIVTNHGEFYKAVNGEEIRYYAKSKKAAAIDFDQKGDPVIVMGFAVYDSTVSTIFAVALYATAADAEAHKAIPAPLAPASVFNASEAPNDAEPAPEASAVSKGLFAKRSPKAGRR